MKQFIFTGILFLLLSASLHAQHQELTEKPAVWKGKQNEAKDSTSLLYAFKQGRVNGHLRYFFMATDNSRGLTDYFANAAGGGLRFETAKFYGFQAGISGFFVFNIGSSNLAKPDSATGQGNRYEIALFDLENPENKYDIDRLEELFIKYNYRRSYIEFGRLLINTPLINLQDGRMRPTGVQGAWFEINEIKQLKIEGGFLYSFSPRGTTRWYRGGASIGVNANGMNPDGTPANYRDNVISPGTAVLGLQVRPTPWLKINLWDYFILNVQNSALLQTDLNYELRTGSTLIGGFQFIRQDALNHGGNKDQTKTYTQKGSRAMTVGARAGWKNKNFETTINYNHITNHGRYLFPREWGRDPFFTFLPRERNDGLGGVHAVMARVGYQIPKIKLSSHLAAGYYHLPDVKNYALNKYGVPSYTQINAEVRYSFPGFLRGLDAQLLIIGKINNGRTYDNPRFVFNKVNAVLYNLVINYHF